jgi:isopropylmalate/homocitrate/citramalate synthase
MSGAANDPDLIYDWNTAGDAPAARAVPIEFDDETLRDGCQSPSVRDPDLETKLRLLHLMEALGIHTLDVGLPGAGPRARADILALCREIADAGLRITPNCAVRTVKADIDPLIEIAQQVGRPIEACTFIGSSPLRQFAEEWTIDHILKLTEEAVHHAVKGGLPVMYVTEDTVRTPPDTVRRLYTAAIEAGARRVCICDTVGHITPWGVRNLVAFVQQVVRDTGQDVKIDWHGHNDRGLAVINTIAAVTAGVDRVHATALGIGERVGNCAMDQLLVNLKLMGYIDGDLTPLAEYVSVASEGTAVPVPINYPIVGKDAFRTATGVHAAAIIKAKRKGDDWLADRVYSGVPAGMVGREQEIEVGFMSGASNVSWWLARRGIPAPPELVKQILEAAKGRDRILTEDEILALCDAQSKSGAVRAL